MKIHVRSFPTGELIADDYYRPSEYSASAPSGDYDLVVAGGGAAGSAAAITAARLGLRVLLIEPLSFLGGTGVASQVTPWMSNHVQMGALNEGLNAELQRDLEATGDAIGYSINPEALKVLLERKASEAGVELLYETTVVDTVLEDGEAESTPRLSQLLLATRQGLYRVQARAFVDATGDAHVANLAGVPCRAGNEQDGGHQPMSLRFVLGNINLGQLHDFFQANADPSAFASRGDGLFGSGSPARDFLLPLVKTEKWPQQWIKTFTAQFFQIPGRPHELWFNCPRITGHDPLDPLSMSRAYCEGRQMIEAYLQLFRKHIDGARDAYLVMSATLMGIREGRRIVGDYMLTGDDFYQRRKFPDGICLNRYLIDIHDPHGRGVTLIRMEPGAWHEIPFRCLRPQGVRGLLVAGRCISSDFTTQASYRIIPNCRTMGEAVAIAAWLASKDGSDIDAVDGVLVRQEMLERGLLPGWAQSALSNEA